MAATCYKRLSRGGTLCDGSGMHGLTYRKSSSQRRTARLMVAALAVVAIGTFLGWRDLAQGQTIVQEHAGCVLRGDGGWHRHANSAHECAGVAAEPAVLTNGDLRVPLTGGHAKVMDINVEEDETFSKFAQCGPSGGLGYVTIRCFDRDGVRLRADDPRFANPFGNLWLSITWINAAA